MLERIPGGAKLWKLSELRRNHDGELCCAPAPVTCRTCGLPAGACAAAMPPPGRGPAATVIRLGRGALPAHAVLTSVPITSIDDLDSAEPELGDAPLDAACDCGVKMPCDDGGVSMAKYPPPPPPPLLA
jgi:hypothetical protein